MVSEVPCIKRCWIPVGSIAFSRSVHVLSHEVSVVVAFVKNTFKVSVFVTKAVQCVTN